MSAAPPTLIALSRTPPGARYTVPPLEGGWYSLGGCGEGSSDYVVCDDISEWPSGLVQSRLEGIRHIIRPGGVLRLVTEDLETAIQAYLLWPATDDDASSRCGWFNTWLKGVSGRFVYNETELSRALARAGFVQIQRFVSGGSAHEVFWADPPINPRALVLEAQRSTRG